MRLEIPEYRFDLKTPEFQKLEAGQKLSFQIANITRNPHDYEGMMYSDGAFLCMFAQIDYGKFAFISIDGNRNHNPVQMKYNELTQNGTEKKYVMSECLKLQNCSDLTCMGYLEEMMEG